MTEQQLKSLLDRIKREREYRKEQSDYYWAEETRDCTEWEYHKYWEEALAWVLEIFEEEMK